MTLTLLPILSFTIVVIAVLALIFRCHRIEGRIASMESRERAKHSYPAAESAVATAGPGHYDAMVGFRREQEEWREVERRRRCDFEAALRADLHMLAQAAGFELIETGPSRDWKPIKKARKATQGHRRG